MPEEVDFGLEVHPEVLHIKETKGCIVERGVVNPSKRNNNPSDASASNSIHKNKRRNPFNRGGFISHCLICDSTMHWTMEYPHKDSKDTKDGQIQLLTENTDRVGMD